MGNTKTHKKLINKPLANPRALTPTSYTQSYTHKNPNQYNGEVLGDEVVSGKNTHTKKLFIEMRGCRMSVYFGELR